MVDVAMKESDMGDDHGLKDGSGLRTGVSAWFCGVVLEVWLRSLAVLYLLSGCAYFDIYTGR